MVQRNVLTIPKFPEHVGQGRIQRGAHPARAPPPPPLKLEKI